MKISLTKIGNSKGIIIPSHYLKECNLGNIVDIDMKDNRLIISKPDQARIGWTEAFSNAQINNDEILIDDGISNNFDEDEWTW
ncbi:MAG: AbrB/MazE/SpoVT family DNA-binding domain-containing protein [Rhodobacteraceae bacterium]|nr:AbrB/MazE/SpoVT family DNA-binding domain-containing protein [Paracoccaceae bacterium]